MNNFLKAWVMVPLLSLTFFSPWGGQRGTAQQLPYFSQYLLNEFYLNPAVSGTKEANFAALSFRMQWLGFKNAPSSQIASFNGPFQKNMGVGAILFNDRTMPYSQTGLQLSYAYRLKVNEESNVSLGLSGMLYQHSLDKDKVTLDEPGDQAVYGNKDKAFSPDANFGLYYYSKDYYVGLSVPQLIQTRMRFSDNQENENKLVRHIFLYGGYRYKASEELEFEPSILVKTISAAPIQFDINAKVLYKSMVWGGLSYRNKESVIILLGANKNNFVLGYSYDITLTQIRKYSTGTHEVYLGMTIPAFKRAKASIE